MENLIESLEQKGIEMRHHVIRKNDLKNLTHHWLGTVGIIGRKIGLIFLFIFSGMLMAEGGVSSLGSNIKPMQAQTVHLGDYTAVIYYLLHKDGAYEVVTTVGPNVGVTALSTQHRVTLVPGQSYTLQLSQSNELAPLTGFKITAHIDSLQVASL